MSDDVNNRSRDALQTGLFISCKVRQGEKDHWTVNNAFSKYLSTRSDIRWLENVGIFLSYLDWVIQYNNSEKTLSINYSQENLKMTTGWPN